MAEKVKAIKLADGTVTNLVDKKTKLSVNYKPVTTYYDGSAMTNAKVDGDLYIKNGTTFYRKVIDKDGELFLEKDTMAQMRALTAFEILLLKAGVYKGVKLNGYYVKGDTPRPIEYLLSTTSNADDGGSIITVGSIKLEHVFKNKINLKYFGLINASSNDTDIVNKTQEAAARYGSEGIIVPYTTNPIMIDAQTAPDGDLRKRGIIQKSDMTVEFEEGARFKAIRASTSAYCMWSFKDVKNVKVINPWVIGDRDEHTSPLGNLYTQRISSENYNVGDLLIIQSTGFRVTTAGTTAPTTLNNIPTMTVGQSFTDGTVVMEVLENGLGQWGHCIEIFESSNISFTNLKAEKAWGDGLYLGCTEGNTDRSTHNNNINLYGKSIFNFCRRQGVSVISCDNFYAQHLYGEDIVGQNPQAVIDFEPNFNYHTIWNAVIDNITSIRCKYSALFASQANRYGITIKNIVDIDSNYLGALHFDGMGYDVAQGDNPDNYVNVDKFYTTKCTKAPVRISNWYDVAQGAINVGSVVVGDWRPDSQGEFSIVKFFYRYPNIPFAVSNINIKGFKYNKLTTIANQIFRPFTMTTDAEFVIHANNVLKNINIVYDDIHVADSLREDSLSLMPVEGKTCKSTPIRNSVVDHTKQTLASVLLHDADIKYTNSLTNTVNIIRRGFNEAILVNNYINSPEATFNLVLNVNSGLTTLAGDGVAITSNSFVLNYGAIVKFERQSDTVLRVTMLYNGEIPVSRVGAIVGGASTNLLDITSNSRYNGTSYVVQYDSSRTGLVNYPPNGRGFIYVTKDPSSTARTFLAIGAVGTVPYIYYGIVSSGGTSITWHEFAEKTATQADSVATDIDGLRADFNSLLAKLRGKLMTT